MEKEPSFLGTGWSFPPEFNRHSGNVKMVSEEQDIEESLRILLSTRLGERVMIPRFGCDLTDLLFESINLTQKTYVIDLIQTAILYYEPRIDVEKIDIIPGTEVEGKLLIDVTYKVRSTNSRRNMVYPFYKTEATDVMK